MSVAIKLNSQRHAPTTLLGTAIVEQAVHDFRLSVKAGIILNGHLVDDAFDEHNRVIGDKENRRNTWHSDRDCGYIYKVSGMYSRNEFADLLHFVRNFLAHMFDYYDIPLDGRRIRNIMLKWNPDNVPKMVPQRGRNETDQQFTVNERRNAGLKRHHDYKDHDIGDAYTATYKGGR